MANRKLKVIVEKDNKEVRYETSLCGIYLMHLGGHFYCGRSFDIHRRSFQHQYEINKLLKEYSSKPSMIPEIHYLKNVMYHLIAHPEICTLRVEIVEICSRGQAVDREQFWLDKSKGTGRSLNLGYEARKSSGDTKIENKNKQHETASHSY